MWENKRQFGNRLSKKEQNISFPTYQLLAMLFFKNLENLAPPQKSKSHTFACMLPGHKKVFGCQDYVWVSLSSLNLPARLNPIFCAFRQTFVRESSIWLSLPFDRKANCVAPPPPPSLIFPLFLPFFRPNWLKTSQLVKVGRLFLLLRSEMKPRGHILRGKKQEEEEGFVSTLLPGLSFLLLKGCSLSNVFSAEMFIRTFTMSLGLPAEEESHAHWSRFFFKKNEDFPWRVIYRFVYASFQVSPWKGG